MKVDGDRDIHIGEFGKGKAAIGQHQRRHGDEDQNIFQQPVGTVQRHHRQRQPEDPVEHSHALQQTVAVEIMGNAGGTRGGDHGEWPLAQWMTAITLLDKMIKT